MSLSSELITEIEIKNTGDDMDKCIKIELPTGHVLLEFDEDLKMYYSVTDKCKKVIDDYVDTDRCRIEKSKVHDGWVEFWIEGELSHFKAVAQYGDEFPV